MPNWRARYETLQRFIEDHPVIEIKSNSTSIPGEVRTEFYEIFDDIRAEYVKELYGAQISEARLAISKFNEAKTRLSALLALEIEVNTNLGFFLADPVAGLTRSTFPVLLSLVRKNIGTEDFERESNKIIEDAFAGFMREIYLQWSTLSLITLLDPDQASSVPMPDETHDPKYTESELRPGRPEEIPQLVPAGKITLYGSHYVPLIVPKLIFHSRRLDTYIAVRTDYHKVFWFADKLHDVIKGMEWHQLRDIVNKFGVFNLWPDIGLYLDKDPEQLRILVTYTEALRPDMILDVWDRAGQDVSAGLDMARTQCNVSLPRKEMFIISREALPKKSLAISPAAGAPAEEGAPPEQAIDLQVLEVGYDSNRLEPIIDCLAKADPAE